MLINMINIHINNVLNNIHYFFFDYYISSYFIGVYRILTVSVLTIYLLYIHKHAINFSKYNGIFPYKIYKNLNKNFFPSIFNYYHFYYFNYIIIYLFYITGLFSIIGIFTNISLLIFIFCLRSLQNRISPILSSGGDIIANIILWSLVLIDCGAKLSLDSFIFHKNIDYINAWSFRLIQITISFGFMSAGIFKLLSKSWRRGTALRNALLFTEWSKNRFTNIFKNKLIYLLSNYAVFTYQIFSPILFWFPLSTPFAIIFGCSLHYMMILTLRIGYFGPITIIGILSFLANYFRL